jgi:hypothetical protein
MTSVSELQMRQRRIAGPFSKPMAESRAHRALVSATADLLGAAGFTIEAVDLPGERRPRLIAGHRPDVTALGALLGTRSYSDNPAALRASARSS